MANRVIVVGSVNVDLVAQADHLPVAGETLIGATFAEHDGGKGANQAVAAARLGAPTAFVGAVGRDAFALRSRAALDREGIDLRALKTVDAPTGVALILVDAHGENMIAVASGANAMLTPAAITEAFELLAPAPGDVVLVGHEIPTLSAKHALRSARSGGATTVFNPAPATDVDRSVFGFADVLTVNELELETILATDAQALLARSSSAPGADDHEERGRWLLASADEEVGVAHAVVVTRGSNGAVLITRDGASLRIPARAVDAIDAVGAGDTFAGSLAPAIPRGVCPPHARRRGG